MRRPLFLTALFFALISICISWQPASADGTFTVTGVHVDASGSSVSEARNSAIAGGRPAAWQALFRRLTRQQDWARQPVLDGPTLQKIITGYFPTNEKRSTTRYVAEVTYMFSPEAVAKLLQSAGIPYASVQAKRVLVIPMAPGYSRGSGWTMALASPRFANSMVPYSVPIGDAVDSSVLSGLVFETASWTDVEPVASRVHASEAVLIQAVQTGAKLTVTLKRLGQGELPTKTSFEIPILQGAQSTYPAAADAAVRAMEDLWKSHAAVDFNQKGKLVADVRFASLAQFAGLQSTLASVPNVSSVNVVAMDIGEARLTISYIGSADQLRDAMAQAGLVLANRGGEWQLSQPGSP
ncbi:MAG: DUF2066 domain-containing protein [Rhizomicrobium sp.]